MGTILTVYNHGTGATSEKPESKKEIVNIFGNADPGECWSDSEAHVTSVKKFITEGVGSSGSPQDHHYTVDPNGNIVHTRDSKAPKPLEAMANLSRTIFGSGVERNVANFVNVIKGMLDHGVSIDKINMIGWSRGAVTCIRQAYRLYQMGRTAQYKAAETIEVNIFAVDPVAGPTHNRELDAITLMPNIKNYVATLAKSENRSSFKPVSAITAVGLTTYDPSKTQSVILPFPGIHADLAKNTNAAGNISFNLCHRFLNHHGSDVSKACYLLSHYEVASHYARLRRAQRGETFTESKLRMFLGETTHVHKQVLFGGVHGSHGKAVALVQGGEARRQLKISTNSDAFFVNAHDKAIFALLLPATYDAYFGSGRTNRNTQTWDIKFRTSLEAEWKRINRVGNLLTELDLVELGTLNSGIGTAGDRSDALTRYRGIWKNGLID